MSGEESVDLFIEGFNDDIKPAGESAEAPVEVQVEEPQENPSQDLVNELADQHGLTPEEYVQAVRDQQVEDEVYSLMAQGVDEELAYEILETRQLKAQQQEESQAKQQQEEEAQNKEYFKFFDLFREINGREYSPSNDKIPIQVWEETTKGKSLVEAYKEHNKDSQFLAGFNSV
jgi:hypothetical protein